MSALFITRDLLFYSNVTGVGRQHGYAVSIVTDSDELLEGVKESEFRLVLLDLTTPGIAVASLVVQLQKRSSQPVSIVAFGPHVDEQGIVAAQKAGFDEVFPRSRFNKHLVEILKKYHANSSSTHDEQ